MTALPPELVLGEPAQDHDYERTKPLATAAALRVPVFPPGTLAQVKSEALEDFMLLSAYCAGECHEERLGVFEELERLEVEWEGLIGWENLRRGSTDKSVEVAKRDFRPRLHGAIRLARFRVRRLTEEIDRLDRDATKVSRAYSIITG